MENLLQHAWPVSRLSERREFECPVQVTGRCGSVEGWCNDLSLGGLGFTAPAEFKAGEQIEVEFTLPIHAERVATSVMIRWTDGFNHGGEFLKPTSELLREVQMFVSSPPPKKSKQKTSKQR